MSGPPMTILIAEDNEADVYLIQEALKGAGLKYEAQIASNGEEALEALQAAAQAGGQSLDAVILDLNLTTHSGLEILEQVRSFPALTGTRVLILTSSVSPSEEQKARSLGTDLYLRKPIDWEEFMQIGKRIVDLLSTQRQAQDL